MFHIGKISYLGVYDFNFVEKVQEKLNEYIADEGNFYLRYAFMNDESIFFLNTYCEISNDFLIQLRNTVWTTCYLLDETYGIDMGTSFTKENLSGIIHSHFDYLKHKAPIEAINTIKSSFIKCKDTYSIDTKYSFSKGVKVLRKTRISPQEATSSIILMLFARDYFNVKAILTLRQYLRNSKWINTFFDMSKCKNNPGRDLMGILFSDYKLIDCIYDLYDKVISDDINHCSILLEENGELIRERFDFICAIIYARYIISLLLGVSSIDLTGDFESLRFDLYLLKIYRTFSVTILNSIYRNLSIFEFSMFSNLEILNDVCIYAPVFATKKKFELASKITSMFAGDAGHKNHGAIINKIIKIVNKKLDNGCKDTHAQMLKHFKNYAEFGGYFEKKSENRGFERALRKAIIETYQQRGLPIAGTRGVSVSHSSKNDNKPFKYMSSFFWDV